MTIVFIDLLDGSSFSPSCSRRAVEMSGASEGSVAAPGGGVLRRGANVSVKR
jgi:hypothetical protein